MAVRRCDFGAGHVSVLPHVRRRVYPLHRQQRVIQNDGIHPLIEKGGKLKLSAGAHRIRVSYFQGPRVHVALVVQVARPAERESHIFHTDEFKARRMSSGRGLRGPHGRKYG